VQACGEYCADTAPNSSGIRAHLGLAQALSIVILRGVFGIVGMDALGLAHSLVRCRGSEWDWKAARCHETNIARDPTLTHGLTDSAARAVSAMS
jgi:hypothetical protein